MSAPGDNPRLVLSPVLSGSASQTVSTHSISIPSSPPSFTSQSVPQSPRTSHKLEKRISVSRLQGFLQSLGVSQLDSSKGIRRTITLPALGSDDTKRSSSSRTGRDSPASLSRTNSPRASTSKDSLMSTLANLRPKSALLGGLSLRKRATSGASETLDIIAEPVDNARSTEERGRSSRRSVPFALRGRSQSAEAMVCASDGESEWGSSIRPRTHAPSEMSSDWGSERADDVSDQEFDFGWDSDDQLTGENTQKNAFVPMGEIVQEPEADALLDEGINIVRKIDPFAMTDKVIRRPSYSTLRADSMLPTSTSKPVFDKDRCTIRIQQGKKDFEKTNTEQSRLYMVASDLSDEADNALDWAIGTVVRSGDCLFVCCVLETDSKFDGKEDRASKMRVQKERQEAALRLSRSVMKLLQRTHLHIRIVCQAIHAKSARRMLLDVIDFLQPTLVIVGSRGVGKLSGILLGSTSNYLLQKSSTPIMVARRRFKRARTKKKPADLSNRKHVALENATIDKVVKKSDVTREDAEVLERDPTSSP